MRRRIQDSNLRAPGGAFVIATLLMALPACSSAPTLAERVQACLDESIERHDTAYWVQGTWHLRGTGKRAGCVNRGLDSEELELGSVPFRVRQSRYALTADALTADALPPTGSAGSTFSLDGTVGQRCVRFVSQETQGDDVVSYDFAAEFLSAHTISGEFTGMGPVAGCRTEGNFLLSIELDKLPAPARAGGGTIAETTDAGPVDREDALCDGAARCDVGEGPDASGDASAAPDSSAASTPDAASDASTGPDADTDAGTNPDAGTDPDAEGDAIRAEAGALPFPTADAGDGGASLPTNDAGAPDSDAPDSDGSTTDESGFQYTLWDLSSEATAQVRSAAKASCSVHGPTFSAGRATRGWVVLAVLLAGLRRRRRPK